MEIQLVSERMSDGSIQWNVTLEYCDVVLVSFHCVGKDKANTFARGLRALMNANTVD